MKIKKILETYGSVGVEANETQEMYKWKPKGETNNGIDNYLSNYGTKQQSNKEIFIETNELASTKYTLLFQNYIPL